MIRLLLMLLFAFLCLDAMHVRTIVKSWFVIFAPGSASLANCLVWAIKSQTTSFCSYLKSIARNNLIYTFSKTAKIHPTGSFSRPEVLFRFMYHIDVWLIYLILNIFVTQLCIVTWEKLGICLKLDNRILNWCIVNLYEYIFLCF